VAYDLLEKSKANVTDNGRKWKDITIGAYRNWFDEGVAALATTLDQHYSILNHYD
jgi:hypothetical protein